MNPAWCRIRKANTLFISILIFFFSISNGLAQNKAQTLHELNTLLINTVMDDIYNPVISSRIYVYPNIAFYECIKRDDPALTSMVGKLNGLNRMPEPTTTVDNFIAACASFSFVGQSLVGSEYKIEDWRKTFNDSLLLHADPTLVNNSMKYGRTVADSIIAWTKRDNYMLSRGMSRFTLSNKAGTWQPTPEDYSQAVEPHWNTIRPLTLRSPAQFSPKEKLRYNPNKNSPFYKTMMDVYKIGKTLDSTQIATAWYWDDNPNVLVVKGHLNYFIHKVSPGGHWLMIAQQACIKKDEPVTRTSLVYTLTAIALFDGFIACWDEKFKTNLIRPITVINFLVDKNWKPLIQTPPFPEFTSGHAVISNAAATVLTTLFGDNFEFTDRTEIPFGNKPRHFSSFYVAAKESSISRVYGGIHYPETARISIGQGRVIGNHVIKKAAPPGVSK